jgi:hypothetical protein
VRATDAGHNPHPDPLPEGEGNKCRKPLKTALLRQFLKVPSRAAWKGKRLVVVNPGNAYNFCILYVIVIHGEISIKMLKGSRCRTAK